MHVMMMMMMHDNGDDASVLNDSSSSFAKRKLGQIFTEKSEFLWNVNRSVDRTEAMAACQHFVPL
jgi:hypothetical protein